MKTFIVFFQVERAHGYFYIDFYIYLTGDRALSLINLSMTIDKSYASQFCHKFFKTWLETIANFILSKHVQINSSNLFNTRPLKLLLIRSHFMVISLFSKQLINQGILMISKTDFFQLYNYRFKLIQRDNHCSFRQNITKCSL